MENLENIKKYYLHEDDFSKLHFEVQDLKSYFEHNQAQASKAHIHGFYQLIWFTTAGIHYIDYEAINHQKNSLVFINTNQIHYFCPQAENEGMLIHFNDFFINQFNQELAQRFSLSIFNEIGQPYITAQNSEVDRIKILLKLIQEENEQTDPLQKEQLFFLLSGLLLSIERIKNQNKIDVLFKNRDFELAYAFKKEVYNHRGSFPSSEYYTQQLHTNTKKLTAVTKQYLGGTPAQIIKNIKVLEAKRKLGHKQLPIQSIAFDLGFDQPTYFTKYFKKITGITPKEFQAIIP
ncbi:AraC family transcriptional regulator [Flavobacterium sp. W22_SRS_FP1]|uniref:AraC family transcriptional regulator n=1 Tax=Flavobacterium sp. W22_SRS_FP1 TaxID=3240276 RepID=UPI003F91E064